MHEQFLMGIIVKFYADIKLHSFKQWKKANLIALSYRDPKRETPNLELLCLSTTKSNKIIYDTLKHIRFIENHKKAHLLVEEENAKEPETQKLYNRHRVGCYFVVFSLV